MMKIVRGSTALILFLIGSYVSAQDLGLDTLNRTDTNNLKQGYWIITGDMRENSGYDPEAVIEEGRYKNGRKDGLWIRYYSNGNKQSEINYVNGRPKGPYKTYYENGITEEKGTWVKQKNTGDFARYYPNGKKMQEFKFNDDGIREGLQLYYYENGQVEVEVTMRDGKENGTMKRYYDNGDLKSTVEVNNGKADRSTYKEYDHDKKEIVIRVRKVETKPAKVETQVKPNLGTINPEGYNKLYTRSLLLKWDGYYHHGKPWDGKKYIYDENGLLKRIEIYKEGLYVGDGVIEKD